MAELKKVLEEFGFTNVKTLLNSGNVVFESEKVDMGLLKDHIEQTLGKKFGFSIPVMLRKHSEVQDLVAVEPFKEITLTPETRLYVTFLSEPPQVTREIPYHSPNKHFSILQVTQDAAFSVLILSKEFDTTKLMAMWEKELGKNVPTGKGQQITTRNWNTVKKIADL